MEDVVADALIALLFHLDTLRNAYGRQRTAQATEARERVEETSQTFGRLLSDLLACDAGPPGHVM